MKFLRLLLAMLSLASATSFAQQYPAKPVRVLLHFPVAAPDELGAFVKQQLGAWSRGFREAGINPE